jgi:hypothetical protein
MAVSASVDSETPRLAANSTKRTFSSGEGRAVMVGIGEVARSLVTGVDASCSKTRTLRYPAINSIPTPQTTVIAEVGWPLVHDTRSEPERITALLYSNWPSLRRFLSVAGNGSGNAL